MLPKCVCRVSLSPMTAAERQLRIQELLDSGEFLDVRQLGRRFSASLSSVRRDLAQLEQRGRLRRVHGGAVSAADAARGPSGFRVAQHAGAGRESTYRQGGGGTSRRRADGHTRRRLHGGGRRPQSARPAAADRHQFAADCRDLLGLPNGGGHAHRRLPLSEAGRAARTFLRADAGVGVGRSSHHGDRRRDGDRLQQLQHADCRHPAQDDRGLSGGRRRRRPHEVRPAGDGGSRPAGHGRHRRVRRWPGPGTIATCSTAPPSVSCSPDRGSGLASEHSARSDTTPLRTVQNIPSPPGRWSIMRPSASRGATGRRYPSQDSWPWVGRHQGGRCEEICRDCRRSGRVPGVVRLYRVGPGAGDQTRHRRVGRCPTSRCPPTRAGRSRSPP